MKVFICHLDLVATEDALCVVRHIIYALFSVPPDSNFKAAEGPHFIGSPPDRLSRTLSFLRLHERLLSVRGSYPFSMPSALPIRRTEEQYKLPRSRCHKQWCRTLMPE